MLLYQNIGIYKWWKLSLILGNCHFVIIFIIKDNILTPRMLLPLAFHLKKIILNPMQQNVLYLSNNDITESPHVQLGFASLDLTSMDFSPSRWSPTPITVGLKTWYSNKIVIFCGCKVKPSFSKRGTHLLLGLSFILLLCCKIDPVDNRNYRFIVCCDASLLCSDVSAGERRVTHIHQQRMGGGSSKGKMLASSQLSAVVLNMNVLNSNLFSCGCEITLLTVKSRWNEDLCQWREKMLDTNVFLNHFLMLLMLGPHCWHLNEEGKMSHVRCQLSATANNVLPSQLFSLLDWIWMGGRITEG